MIICPEYASGILCSYVIAMEQHGQLCVPLQGYITSLVSELHWLVVCFQIPFKVLILTFKPYKGLYYLRDRLFLIISTHQVNQEKHAMGLVCERVPSDRI